MVFLSDTSYTARSQPWASGRSFQEKQIYFMVFALDLLAMMIAYQVSMSLAGFLVEYYQTSPLENFYESAQSRQIVYFCVALGIMFFLALSGHYTRRVPWWSQLQQVSKIIFFAVIVDGFTSYALELHYSRILIATNWIVAYGMLLIIRLGMNMIKSCSEEWKLSAVIIADANTATDALYALASDGGTGLNARTILLQEQNIEALDREELPASYRNIDVRTAGSSYESYILANPDCFYIVSLEGFSKLQRDQLLKLLKRNDVSFALIPDIAHTSLYQSEPHYFFGNDIMLLDSKKPMAPFLGKVLKRSMDIIGALIALIIFALPLSLVALMLKLEGQGGSVLYAGTRVGQGGKLFRCWKFRTMEPGTDHLLHEYLAADPEARAHWNRYFKLPNDPRVQTRTARFIRRASIDELPQIWNVLKGEMSLVGPRPILVSEIEAYGERIDEYKSVKPGITGLWQASGRNGTSFHRRVLWDSWYVRNWTLWGDIIIILKTIQVVLNKSGAS